MARPQCNTPPCYFFIFSNGCFRVLQRRFSADYEWIHVTEARFPIHCPLQNPEKERKKGFAKSFPLLLSVFVGKGAAVGAAKLAFTSHHFNFNFLKKQGFCHTLTSPFTLKSILKAKEELGKFKSFSIQKYNLQKKKNPLQETKILQDIYKLYIANLKFQQHKPKFHLSKILISK